MKKYKNVPISSAKKIAEEYDKNQVIIVTWDRLHNKSHVTTYGKTPKDCVDAAHGGNRIKKMLGWPDDLCHAVPKRIVDYFNRNKQNNIKLKKNGSK